MSNGNVRDPLRFTEWACDAALCAGTPRPPSDRAKIGDRSEEDAMILVVFDPRTGERVTIEVAETPHGKRIVRTTRRNG
jgi:hypothetical protein